MLQKLIVTITIAVLLAAGAYATLPAGDVSAKPEADFTVTAPEITGTTTLYPSQNYVLTATGYGAGELVELLINGTRLSRGAANGSGQYTATVKIPNTIPYTTNVTMKSRGATGVEATYTAAIKPGLVLSVVRGAAGNSFPVQGFSFGRGETYTVTFVSAYDLEDSDCIDDEAVVSTTLKTGTTTQIGSFSFVATVPSVPAGTYYVVAVGSSSAVCTVK